METDKENIMEMQKAIEENFRQQIADALPALDIPTFAAGKLELARSEKEIAKCQLIQEKEKKKLESKDKEGKKDIRKRQKNKRKPTDPKHMFAPLKQKRTNYKRKR